MIHPRTDYDAIQPWPTKRPHTGKVDGSLIWNASDERGVDPLIPDDEPVFLLRAQDPSAAAAVRAWAVDAEGRGVAPDVVAGVRRWADRMEEYAHDRGKRKADLPLGVSLRG